jgi:spore coat protein U-like protein
MLQLASNRLRTKAALAAIIGAAIAAPAHAGSASGTIGISLNVSAACIVSGATQVTSTLGSVGSVQFADQPGLFGNVDSQLNVSGGGALSVQCSPGAGPSLTLGAGAHDSAGLHYMAAGANNVAYHLFTDSARSNEISIGQSIPLGTASSSPIAVPIYARVNSGGAVLPAGSYTDTVQVTLAW